MLREGRPIRGLRRWLGVLLAVACTHAIAHQGDHRADPSPVIRSTANYIVPDVTVVRADGAKVSFSHELDDGRPVLLQFVYTTCTTVCPLTSQVFADVQSELRHERNSAHLVSISIDPEQDTAERLEEHARKFGAGPQWQHYTSSVQASVAIQRAFNVYRGDKMNHLPVTFIRIAPGQRWLRLEGFATAGEVVREYRALNRH